MDIISIIIFFVGAMCGMLWATINSINERRQAERDLNNYLTNRSQIFNKSDLANGWGIDID